MNPPPEASREFDGAPHPGRPRPPSRSTSSTLTGEPGRTFEVAVSRSWSYPVVFEPGLLARFGTLLRQVVGDITLFVLSDERVHGLYGPALDASLAAAGYRARGLTIPPGERSKSVANHAHLLERLAELGCDRRSVLVNFGGGVVSDLGGYVAASYMRGIRYANLSTSLLGQIDACVGGKVAVDTEHAKNLVGAFHHPVLAAGDPLLLATLDEREFRAGLAEGIKVAILGSPELFERFERERTAIFERRPSLLTEIVHEGTRIKMELIEEDPYEDDLRRPLNLGHTIGHPIETEHAYEGIRHGEAVAIGTGIATTIARDRGWLAPADAERILGLLADYGLLGLGFDVRAPSVLRRVRYVRLIRGHALNFVLPTSIGSVRIVPDLPDAELAAGIEGYFRRARELVS